MAPAVEDRPLGDVEQLPLGSIVQSGTGTFRRLTSTGREEHRVPGTQRAELEALCGLRDRVRGVLAADATDDPGAAAQRAALNDAYDRYTDRYGPLNRFVVRAAGPAIVFDPDDAEQGDVVATKRVYPPLGGFRTDPGWWSVAALEVFDDDTQLSSKAPILAGPVARTASYPVHVDDPTVAVQVLLARDGAVTVPAVAELAGLDEAAVEAWLGDAVYRDPATAELVPAATYLSGVVRDKLDIARDAAATDPSFRRHVEALEAVVPAWIRPEEITPRIGASWVPAGDLRQFVVDELGLEHAEVSHVPELASWTINAGGYSAENEFTYAVEGRGRKGVDLVEDLANQRPTRITRDVEGRRVLDVDATAAAAAKRGQLEDLYAAWLWSDPDRSERLAATYNARFNAWVEPRWSGDSLRFDGLATGFQPRQHQLDAVARILGDRDRGTLLAHTVGAGKTAVMAMSAMELRRLGIATGPVGIVVPNSMLQQFGREFAQLYPQANILAADDANFSRDQRREFTARAASGAYDVVLFTHSSFTALPASPATVEAATTREVDSYRRALSAVEGEGPSRTQARTVKQIETAIAGLEVKLEKLADRARHDPGSVAFEELGLGHLMVDEAHLCKNLSFPTRIDAVQVKESARARDLLIKVDWMREHRGPGSVTFSTATPVTNQISEMWVF
ncbi:MAG: DEAD/DEAH box helicase family protein, partial [Actinobacteria bacterium]|nr:DEAD/DEAH box helicase family protein [Actinomycetota bacterium]